MTNKRGLILHKTKHNQMNKNHDYKIYKKNHTDTPKEIEYFESRIFGSGKRLFGTKIGITC